MAGDVWVSRTGKLTWPANSSGYYFVVDFLLAHATRPQALALLRDADENGLGVVDMDDLAPVDRDELCELLRDRLIPYAADRDFAAELAFGELRDHAAVALARYRGREITGPGVVLAPGVRWCTDVGLYWTVLSFLVQRLPSSPLSRRLIELTGNGEPGDEGHLDLTALLPGERADVLRLLDEELVDYWRAIMPDHTASRARQLGKLGELADLARSLRTDLP